MIYTASPVIEDEEINAVLDVLKSGMLVENKYARQLEEEFSKYIGTKYATVTTSGTTALHVALEAAGIQPGDEVITTPFTFIASSNAILFVGGIPVFADIDPETYNIDPESIKKKITPKTKAIMPVHIFGLPADMKAIMEIAEEHNLLVIEDCAQAHGATIDGKKVGSFGDIAAFSFYATKNMMSGEGGIVLTNNEEMIETAKAVKNHGRGAHGGYHYYRIGYNFRMMDLVAAIAVNQLKKLPKFLDARRKNVEHLVDIIGDLDGIKIQKEPKGYRSAWHVFGPRLTTNKISRDKLIEELRNADIGARTLYSIPCYAQPAYKDIQNWRWAKFVKYPDYSKVSCPNAELVGNEHFELPIHPRVSDDQIEYIGTTLKKILTK